MSRQNISSGSPYEKSIGFSRAVRCGTHISVSGTAPVAPDGGVSHQGDLYGQTKRCLEIIEEAIVQAGGQRKDTVRTRIMLTDISRWEDAARAHGEYFSEIRPACTFVEVSGLINPLWLVEVEAEAICSE